jgi:nuclear pore complex protein Nup43
MIKTIYYYILQKNLENFFTLAEADSCSLNAAVFTSHDEILTGNSRGMIKLWDVRTNSGKPVHSSSLAEDSEVITILLDFLSL